jgi:hypothetical protein
VIRPSRTPSRRRLVNIMAAGLASGLSSSLREIERNFRDGRV